MKNKLAYTMIFGAMAIIGSIMLIYQQTQSSIDCGCIKVESSDEKSLDRM